MTLITVKVETSFDNGMIVSYSDAHGQVTHVGALIRQTKVDELSPLIKNNMDFPSTEAPPTLVMTNKSKKLETTSKLQNQGPIHIQRSSAFSKRPAATSDTLKYTHSEDSINPLAEPQNVCIVLCDPQPFNNALDDSPPVSRRNFRNSKYKAYWKMKETSDICYDSLEQEWKPLRRRRSSKHKTVSTRRSSSPSSQSSSGSSTIEKTNTLSASTHMNLRPSSTLPIKPFTLKLSKLPMK